MKHDEGILDDIKMIKEKNGLIEKIDNVKEYVDQLIIIVIYDDDDDDDEKEKEWIDENENMMKMIVVNDGNEFNKVIKKIYENSMNKNKWVVISHYKTYLFISNILRLIKQYEMNNNGRKEYYYVGYPFKKENIIYGSLSASILINWKTLGVIIKSNTKFENVNKIDYKIGVLLDKRDIKIYDQLGFYPCSPEKVIKLLDDNHLPDNHFRKESKEAVFSPPISFGDLKLEDKRRMMNKIERIPKIIHQIWVGPKAIPKEVFECKQRYEKCGWKHMLWTDKNIDWIVNSNLIKKAKNVFNKRGDMIRFEVLFKFGGIYLDADSVCIRAMDDLLDDVYYSGKELFSACENEKAKPGLIAPGVMGSTPKSLSSYVLLRSLHLVKISGMAWISTGPFFVTKTINSFKLPVYLANSGKFYPMHHSEIKRTLKKIMNENMYKRTCQLNSYTLQLWGTTFSDIQESDEESGSTKRKDKKYIRFG